MEFVLFRVEVFIILLWCVLLFIRRLMQTVRETTIGANYEWSPLLLSVSVNYKTIDKRDVFARPFKKNNIVIICYQGNLLLNTMIWF